MDPKFDFEFRLPSRETSVCECDDAFNPVDDRFPPTGTARELCRRWNAYPTLLALAKQLHGYQGDGWDLQMHCEQVLQELGELE